MKNRILLSLSIVLFALVCLSYAQMNVELKESDGTIFSKKFTGTLGLFIDGVLVYQHEAPPIDPPGPISPDWLSVNKDSDNSRLANPINLPLIVKWVASLPVRTKPNPYGPYPRSIRSLYKDGKVIFCMSNHGVAKEGIVVFDAVTGSHLWTNKIWGVVGSNGMYSIRGNDLFGGNDHATNWKINLETGVLTGMGNTGVMESYTNTDGNVAIGYGMAGIDSRYVIIKAINPDGTLKWSNYRDAITTGVSYSYYGAYNGMGQLAIHDGITYVPDGILWAYNPNGTVLWKTGAYPRLAKVGEIVYYSEVVYNDGKIFTFGRQCTEAPTPINSGLWTNPKLFAFDAANGHLLFSIDLPEYANLPHSAPSLWLLYNAQALPFQAVVNEDRIYVSTPYSVLCFSISTQARVWEWPRTMGTVNSYNEADIVLAGDTLFVMGNYDPHIYALSADDGLEIWSFASQDGSLFAGMIIVDGYLFASSNSGLVYCLE